MTGRKKQALEGLVEILALGRKESYKAQPELIASLYQRIGQVKVELD